MCGRFSLRDTTQVQSAIKKITPRYNIAPSNKILTLTDEAASMRWG